MTYTIKSGDTLSKVARANGITLEQLLDANPRFRANPNRIRVGDVLNIPDGADAPAPQPAPAPVTPPQPPTPPIPPQPQPSPAHVLGKLSERYETGGRGPGVVSTGAGDSGGASYGSYQMTSKPGGGTVGRFVAQPDFPFRDRFAGLTPGTSQFTSVWKRLADSNRDEFQNAQHDYIKRTHFDLLVKKIMDEDGINVLTLSNALQDVIWSTAVQHGPGASVPHIALSNTRTRPGDPSFDRDFITAIYAERGRKGPNGVLVRFSRNSPKVQQGVAQRFQNELRDALDMLAQEQAG